ncbi:class I SAM-dependent methyltransferase [Primorskyibacter flagellatus]|uniref:16S rRNA m(2)G 1207 methyltransferase n=1 Tax=Primorskyibacter flagellatus TaxID=1387277 RepID=A0A1W1ZPG7_9RHOB|nr:class I SAM-dependent methyltransferase [Primorskyibacter flagellatus]SMC50294.1 16S rRNA m(2)G 1207 methyltransferase [Primorskyibacter flagellatus]
MASSRLTHALESAELTLPAEGRIALFQPRADSDLQALPKDRCDVISSFYPDVTALRAHGFRCVLEPEGSYAAAIVFLPRTRTLAEALIAQAVAAAPGGIVAVDGFKTDGIEAALRKIRKLVTLEGLDTRAHGKLFWFSADDIGDDWTQTPQPQIAGFTTAPGVFSADGIDPGSEALVAALPAKLGAHVVDLGAGWGYLANQVLERESVARLDLVEADHTALDCARRNISDPRAMFHWDDATSWRPETRADSVVMNPPFHTGRAPDPSLGQAFVASAAACLKPSGQLWMVANRHLPYEATLAQHFTAYSEVGGDNRFKILHAQRPLRRDR